MHKKSSHNASPSLTSPTPPGLHPPLKDIRFPLILYIFPPHFYKSWKIPQNYGPLPDLCPRFFYFLLDSICKEKKNAQCNSATFTVNYLPIAFDASSQTLLFSGLICLHYGMLELGILFHRVSPFLFLSLFLSLFYHFQLRLPRIY